MSVEDLSSQQMGKKTIRKDSMAATSKRNRRESFQSDFVQMRKAAGRSGRKQGSFDSLDRMDFQQMGKKTMKKDSMAATSKRNRRESFQSDFVQMRKAADQKE